MEYNGNHSRVYLLSRATVRSKLKNSLKNTYIKEPKNKCMQV